MAAGGSFCAVATSRRHLRLLSQAGTQVRGGAGAWAHQHAECPCTVPSIPRMLLCV